MSKLRKKFITLFAVLLCAMLALATVLICIPKSITANADYDKDKFTQVGSSSKDLYAGNNKFDADLLSQLYEKLAGSGATYEKIEKLINDDNEDHAITAAEIYSRNSSYISVWFGGFKWDVTYVTRARSTGNDDKDLDGNIIIDLWQSADGANATQGTPTSGTYLKTIEYWSPKTAEGTTYPANMYSTSYIRVVGLNSGGFYALDGGLIATRYQQVATNYYAHLTMASSNNGKDSLIKYIVQPKNVAYQEFEKTKDKYVANGAIPTYQAPNDAYGFIDDDEYSGPELNYYGKGEESIGTSYGYWKNDYLWLPSFAETGNTDDTGNGIWKTSSYLRSTVTGNAWLRSGPASGITSARCLTAGGGHGASLVTTVDNYVRPALHFNLTKAAFKAGGITFGTDGAQISNVGDVKTAKVTYDYKGKDYELTIPDSDKLEFTDPDNYVKDGKFTVKLPNGSDNENYEITVTPKSGYYWADADTVEEGKKPRKYQIHINKATIETDWKDFSVKYGGSLLQDTEPKSKTVEDITVDFEVEYCITFAEKGTPQEPSTKNWKPAEQLDTTAASMGKYRVDYKIEDVDGNHKPLESGYIVTVNADTVTISVKGDGIITGSGAEYAGEHDTKLADQDWLKDQFAQKVTMTGTNASYPDKNAVLNFLSEQELKVVLLKDGSSGKVEVTQNDYGRFDVGTYYLGLQESSSIGFKWDTDGAEKYPSFTIIQRGINVGIVAADDGNLKHVYGYDPAAINYKADDDSLNKEINDEFPHVFKITDAADSAVLGSTLGKTTPVGRYMIEGTVSDDSNFDVTFNDTAYEVEKRPVKLKVADETVEYGTNFAGYKFKNLELVDSTLATGDTPSKLSSTYYLIINGGEVELSDSLAVGEYELRVRVDNGNYEFSYVEGKLTVIIANYDMSGVTFKNAGYVYDGNPHAMACTGTMPSSEISVTYVYVNMADGSESTEPPTEIGLYLVYARFSHSNPNYNGITDKVAYLRIAATQEELNQAFPPLPTDDEIAAAADLAKKKTEAKKTLDEEAKKKKDEIDANPDMTDEEKQAAKDKVDEELQKGNAAINSATNADEVNRAYNDGKANIEKIKAEHKEESSFPWWIIAVAAVVLAVLVVIIIIVVKRRNSEDEEEDYYDDDYDYDEEDYDEEDFGDDF